jgi:DNA-binding IclR family transcriptional regulator
MLPAQPNQSLIDGLAVLQALASAGGPVGSRGMARQLNLEHTRVNRLLKTLAHLGIAQQTPDKQYTSGPAMHVLAAQAMFGSGLLQRAIDSLQSLRPLKLAIAMGVLWRDHVSYLYHGSATMSPGQAMGRTGLFPATRSGIGIVLLSRMKEADVRSLYGGREVEGFEGIDQLLEMLVDVRRRGLALVRPYADQPTQTLAVAIEGQPAAVALSGRIDSANVKELATELRRVAAEIVKA